MLDQRKAITLGHPSYVWRFGQERRLRLVRQYVSLEQRRILDIGCGLGMYLNHFRLFSKEAYGLDIDRDRLVEGARRGIENTLLAVSESLPFQDQCFDVVFLNEVIEHVRDDRATIQEAYRILREGGEVVIYAPNRLYFFETHGFYLGKRYIFGLLPLVNWLPRRIRNIFVPHARCYLAGELKGLFDGLPMRLVVHTVVYPGFDNIAARRPWLAALLRKLLYLCEQTPLRVFGLSHFLVMRKEAR